MTLYSDLRPPKKDFSGNLIRISILEKEIESLNRIIKEGKKVALLNFGTRLEECKKASDNLLKKGIDCTIIDARFAKPLDEKLIMEIASNHEVLISIE